MRLDPVLDFFIVKYKEFERKVLSNSLSKDDQKAREKAKKAEEDSQLERLLQAELEVLEDFGADEVDLSEEPFGKSYSSASILIGEIDRASLMEIINKSGITCASCGQNEVRHYCTETL